MKKLSVFVSFFVCVINASLAQAGAERKISYDGYYRTLSDSTNPFSFYLRFYADGTVIGYTTAGNPKNLVPWFKKEHKSPSKGQYILKDSTISFSLKSEEGIVLYDGVIYSPGDRMVFTVKSLINKYEGREEYFFLKMEGVK